jgi:Putative adhesin
MRHSPYRRILPVVFLLGSGPVFGGCDVSIGNGDVSLGLASGKATEEWVRSYPIAPGGRFEVININGLVEVEAASGEKIEVKAERIAKSSSDDAAREALKNLEIVETVGTDSVKLQTKQPSTFGRTGYEVRYFVKVPKGVKVLARSTNGGVRLTALSNEVQASTVNGGVTATGIVGSLDASTTNGGLRISVDELGTGGIKLAAVNGGVDLSIPRTARADISARVVNGGLSVGDLPVETTQQSRRRLEGKLNGGGARVEVSTTNGGVRISGK